MIQERGDKPERQPGDKRDSDIARPWYSESELCTSAPPPEQEYEEHRD